MKYLIGLLLIGSNLCLAAPSSAQVPPTVSQVKGFSPLHLAAHRGDLIELNRLLAQNMNVDLRDNYGRTALMVATFSRHSNVINLLIDAGANTGLLENDRYDALTIAGVADFPDIVKLLIKRGVNPGLTTSIYDGTALIASAHLGHVEVVRALVEGGAPLDHVNNLDWTALIEAIVLGDGGKRHTKIVQILVDAGANVNLADGDGTTPLALAKVRGYNEIAAVLTAAGGL